VFLLFGPSSPWRGWISSPPPDTPGQRRSSKETPRTLQMEVERHEDGAADVNYNKGLFFTVCLFLIRFFVPKRLLYLALFSCACPKLKPVLLACPAVRKQQRERVKGRRRGRNKDRAVGAEEAGVGVLLLREIRGASRRPSPRFRGGWLKTGQGARRTASGLRPAPKNAERTGGRLGANEAG